MKKSVQFSDLWPHLEQLDPSEIQAVVAAASSDKRYRQLKLKVFGVAIALGLALFFGVMAISSLVAPSPLVLLGSIVALVLLIALVVKRLSAATTSAYHDAVMRQINARDLANGT